MKIHNAMLWLPLCAIFLNAGFVHSADNDDEISRYYEKDRKITEKILPFLQSNDKEKIKLLYLEAAKNYNVKKAPLHFAHHLNSAANYSSNRSESLKLYIQAIEILLGVNAKTKSEERHRAIYLNESASGGFIRLFSLENQVNGAFEEYFKGEDLEVAKKLVYARQVSCELSDPNFKNRCDITIDTNTLYRKILAATGDSAAAEIQHKIETQQQEAMKKFKLVGAELTAARKSSDHAAIIRFTSKFLTDYEKELSWAGFLKALIYFDRALSFSKLNKPVERDAEFERAHKLLYDQPVLTVSSLEGNQFLAKQYGLDHYAEMLSPEIKAIKIVGDTQSDSAVMQLSPSNEEGLQLYREARDRSRKKAIKLQELGAMLSTAWAQQKYQQYDNRYREMAKEYTAERTRLQREAEEDKQRSQENIKLLFATLHEASNILNGSQTGPSEEFIRTNPNTASLSSCAPTDLYARQMPPSTRWVSISHAKPCSFYKPFDHCLVRIGTKISNMCAFPLNAWNRKGRELGELLPLRGSEVSVPTKDPLPAACAMHVRSTHTFFQEHEGMQDLCFRGAYESNPDTPVGKTGTAN